MKLFKVSVLLFFSSLSVVASANIKDLSYPASPPSAEEIAQQNQFVDKFYGFSRMPVANQPGGRAILIKGKVGGPLSRVLVERYINTNTDDPVEFKELGSFLSGPYNSMTFLITHFSDGRNPMFQVWRPDLRKVRRIPPPLLDDRLAGSDFSWGEMVLQRPEFEKHEVVKQTIFNRCLGSMQTPVQQKWMAKLPQGSCHQKNRPVYVLKSTPIVDSIKEYDYRIRFIDRDTFADYRTEYYKDGQLVRFVDKSWGPMGMEDPRIQAWSYMYGKDLVNDHESLFVQLDRNTTMTPRDSNFWSGSTLRFLNR